MSIADTRTVSIVGDGMAGTMLSILLSRRGIPVDLFEKHPDPHSGQRHISLASNLALGERARHALRMTGLLEQVDALSTPMRGRMIHDRSGQVTLQPYGYREYETLYSVRRESLLQCLLYEASTSRLIQIHYGHTLQEVDWDGCEAVFTVDGEDGPRRHSFEVLIGADGPVSRVRRSMAQVADLGVNEKLLDAGYKFLSIPALGDGRAKPTGAHLAYLP